ncbi:MAG: FAD-dependent monooxygenase [Chlamydiae bacterium]|nr:FAD-dependent monooxygenase [Chlamydiota bacterium]
MPSKYAITFFLGFFVCSFLQASDFNGLEQSLKVLIVGAGPAGLSVAKALQNRGVYPDIIEKQACIIFDGAGFAVPANGSWALEKLGIDITEKALVISQMQFTDDQGSLLAKDRVDTIHPDGAQFYSLTRNELMDSLLASLHKDTHIQTSTTITHFSEENDQVKVVFSDGRIKYYDFVIGCDGVRSTLRSKVHPEELPEFLGLFVWRAIVNTTLDLAMPTYMVGADRGVLLYPMLNNKIYVYGHIFQKVKDSDMGSFSKEFSSFGGDVPEVIDAIESEQTKFHHCHLYKSHSVRFTLDGFTRVLLMGDASHACGPMLQNGAAQSFEDAYVLQDLLSDKLTKEEIPPLIEAFKKRRLSRVEKVYMMSNAKIQAISDPMQIAGRNEAIRREGPPNVNAFKILMQGNP